VKTCVVCGNTFYRAPGERKSNFDKKRTCSQGCRYDLSAMTRRESLREWRESQSREPGEIPLSGGGYTYVDPCDHDLAMGFTWYEEVRETTSYAVTSLGGKRMTLHRLLLDAPDGVEVDHADGDGLNNRRSNIRLATRSQNTVNTRNIGLPRSGYRGVYQNTRGGRKWKAMSGEVLIGYFATAAEAAVAYDHYMTETYGEFAVTNKSILQKLLHEYEALCDQREAERKGKAA
jgi:hypothetical protein